MGYDNDHIGWYVQDLKGSYHFSCDVVSNESVPGHLSPIHPVAIAPDSLPSLCPVWSQVCTTGRQAFADVIHAHDVALVSCCF